ncbi:Alkaline phosphatase precursor [compost metagenome]
MTAKAIDLLSQNSQGYFLMVEGGRIDHALHATNAKRSLTDAVALDEAVKTALGKVDLSDTLIVVTADHDHTMTINGYSAKGNPVLDLVKNGDGSTQNDVDGKPFTTLVFGNGPNRADLRPTLTSNQVMGDDYLQETGVKLGSETHGGGDVMLFAGGAGSDRFKGTLDNTLVFGKLREALGL